MDRFIDFLKFLDQLQGTHNTEQLETDLNMAHQLSSVELTFVGIFQDVFHGF